MLDRALRLARGHWQLLILTALVALFWHTPAALPLRILIVFLHELAHAATAILTGGSVLGLTVDPMEGGSVLSRGGNRFLTLSAGYFGSLLIGAMLFFFAVRSRWDRVVLGLLGIVMLAVTVLYVRDWFAVGFGVATGTVLIAVARFLAAQFSDLILRVIGLASMIYVPLDLYGDTIARAHLRSDARMLAEEYGGHTLIWGGVWLILSLIVIALSLRYGLGRNSNIRLRGAMR